MIAKVAVALVLFAGCGWLGEPPMAPLTGKALEAAQHRWETRGDPSYRVVVRVRAPRIQPILYSVTVASGGLATVMRNGEPVDLASYDYSVQGLFTTLAKDLRLIEGLEIRDVPPIDLRAEFDAATGRLLRYRRTVGTDRRRVLLVEVIDYEAGPPAQPPPAAGSRS